MGSGNQCFACCQGRCWAKNSTAVLERCMAPCSCKVLAALGQGCAMERCPVELFLVGLNCLGRVTIMIAAAHRNRFMYAFTDLSWLSLSRSQTIFPGPQKQFSQGEVKPGPCEAISPRTLCTMSGSESTHTRVRSSKRRQTACWINRLHIQVVL